MAFQLSGFQRSAFQVGYSSTPPEPAPPQGTGWGKLWHWPKHHEERLKRLPEPVQEAIAEAVVIKEKDGREIILKRRLAGIEDKFLDLYLQILEIEFQILLDDQLKKEQERIRRLKQEEEIFLILASQIL